MTDTSPPSDGRARGTIAFEVDPPRAAPVGHLQVPVRSIRFSISRAGWLRALVNDSTWLSLVNPTPQWVDDLAARAMRDLPGAKRTT